MTTAARNAIFEEHTDLIDLVIRKYYRLIQSCRLNEDDVRQDLSIEMLEAIEKYNPEIGPSLRIYLKQRLGYTIMNMVVPSKLYGVPKAPRTKSFQVLSLDAPDLNGVPMQIPVFDDHPACILIQDEINLLPDSQRAVITDLLYGKRVHSNNKSLREARKQIRERMDEIGLTRLPTWKECVACA